MKYTTSILCLTLLLLSACGKKEETISPKTSEKNETVEQIEIIPEDIKPSYIEDPSESYGNTDEKILFFYSENSEKSKEFDALLKSGTGAEIFSDVIKIDFDDESEAKEVLEIASPNSFALIDQEGNLIKKIENIETIKDIIQLYE